MHRSLKGVVLRRNLLVEELVENRDLLHDVVADPGYLGEEEEGEDASDAAEAAEDGAAGGGQLAALRRGVLSKGEVLRGILRSNMGIRRCAWKNVLSDCGLCGDAVEVDRGLVSVRVFRQRLVQR
jgi:hypothetical protein